MSETTKRTYAPILPPAFAAVLGEFVASWSGTSGLLAMLLSDLVAGRTLGEGDDVTGSMVLIGMDTRVQLGFIKTLGVARIGKENEKTIEFLVQNLEKSKRQRDFVAHAMWSIDAKGRLIAHSLKTVGKVRYIERHISNKHIVEEIASLVTTTEMLVKLFKKHGYLSGMNGWNGKFF